uniref:Uncharacterized protein n=1 Tax=Onchocerca volvulus TaxID=6282 RepID=A0A8R1XPL5_ONCVO
MIESMIHYMRNKEANSSKKTTETTNETAVSTSCNNSVIRNVKSTKELENKEDGKIPFHRPNPNPNMKPRWITVTGLSLSGASCTLETSTHLTYSEPKLHYQVFYCFERG